MNLEAVQLPSLNLSSSPQPAPRQILPTTQASNQGDRQLQISSLLGRLAVRAPGKERSLYLPMHTWYRLRWSRVNPIMTQSNLDSHRHLRPLGLRGLHGILLQASHFNVVDKDRQCSNGYSYVYLMLLTEDYYGSYI